MELAIGARQEHLVVIRVRGKTCLVTSIEKHHCASLRRIRVHTHHATGCLRARGRKTLRVHRRRAELFLSVRVRRHACASQQCCARQTEHSHGNTKSLHRMVRIKLEAGLECLELRSETRRGALILCALNSGIITNVIHRCILILTVLFTFTPCHIVILSIRVLCF